MFKHSGKNKEPKLFLSKHLFVLGMIPQVLF